MPEERRQYILTRLSQDGRVEVVALAEACHASIETIRKDLILLEKRGLLQRVHGGALPATGAPAQATVATATGEESGAAMRLRLAQAARKALPDEGAIFLDASPACEAIAQTITTPHGVTFVTNGIAVASQLAPVAMTNLIGGVVHPGMRGTIGANALDQIFSFVPNWAVIGAEGFTVEDGVMTSSPEVGKFLHIVASNADQVMVILEPGVAGNTALARAVPFDYVNVVVAPEDIDPDLGFALVDAGCKLITV